MSSHSEDSNDGARANHPIKLGNLEKQPTGISWVYDLRKPEVIAALEQRGLPTDGNLDANRKRLVQYLREHDSRLPPRVSTPQLILENRAFKPVHTKPQMDTEERHTLTETIRDTFSPLLSNRPPPVSITNLPWPPSKPSPWAEPLKHFPPITIPSMVPPYQTAWPAWPPPTYAPAPTFTVPSWSLPNNTGPPLITTTVAAPHSPSPSNISNSAPVPPPPKLRKWNVFFDGRGDAAAFLERIEEICESGDVDINRILPQMPDLLRREPAAWFRNNRSQWHTWGRFSHDFRDVYLPINYRDDLEVEISRRIQKPHEPVSRYFTELQTLMRRHGSLTDEQQLSWLYRNLLPEFRLNLRRSELRDVTSFTRAARELESLLREMEPPSSSTVSKQFPTTTSNATMRSATTPNPPASTPKPPPLRPASAARVSPTNAPAPNIPRNMDCWRCGKSGHFRTECTEPARIFCSRCRRDGIMSRDCPCKPGNAGGAAQ